MEDKRIQVKFGKISYFKINSDKDTILFIHDISSTREWIKQVHKNLPDYKWIVPDLIGFGSSSKTESIEAFRIEQYTEDLLCLIKREEIKSLIIIAHGFAGVIAMLLTDLLSKENVIIKQQFHIMSILSIKDLDPLGNDSFEVYKKNYDFDIERYNRINTPMAKLIAKHLKKISPYSIWATHHQLNRLFDTLNIGELVNNTEDIHYLVGEKLRGAKESEKLMKRTKHTVSIISDSQHNIHLENPSELWQYVIDNVN